MMCHGSPVVPEPPVGNHWPRALVQVTQVSNQTFWLHGSSVISLFVKILGPRLRWARLKDSPKDPYNDRSES